MYTFIGYLGLTYFNSHSLSCYKIFRILGYLMTICKESLHKFRTGKYLFIDLICTNLCTCVYEYNITYAVTLVTLFAPTCFDPTGSSSGSLICPC